MGVLVVALLLVPAADRGADGLYYHDLAALWLPHVRVLLGLLRAVGLTVERRALPGF
jgi:hypothetical protein